VTLDLSHLAKDVREQAFESSAARVRHVQEARWIAHERVQRVLDELEWRFDYPTCSRMPCLLLYGDSGMGKTMAIEKFKRLHPPSYDHKAGITKSPVVIVNMPSSPKERRFFARLLDSLHAPFSAWACNECQKCRFRIGICPRCGIRTAAVVVGLADYTPHGGRPGESLFTRPSWRAVANSTGAIATDIVLEERPRCHQN
jgi:hypothetical protein